jgi:hypothetical protein
MIWRHASMTAQYTVPVAIGDIPPIVIATIASSK